MQVTRVRTERGSHIEPPFDESWPEVDRLRWKAAVAANDSGLSIRVVPVPFSLLYSVQVEGTSTAMPGVRVWDYLSGVVTGAEAARGGVA